VVVYNSILLYTTWYNEKGRLAGRLQCSFCRTTVVAEGVFVVVLDSLVTVVPRKSTAAGSLVSLFEDVSTYFYGAFGLQIGKHCIDESPVPVTDLAL
jgi:hypothetical protein